MNVPKEIWLCGQRYDIVVDGEFSKKYGIYGAIKFDECCIELNSTCSIDFLRETLLHELLHGIDRALVGGWGIVEVLRRTPDESLCRLTEPEVLAYSRGLWMTLTDPRNCEVVDWMLGRV